MVRAEISYNPYLLETKVIFNNQPPKMNSRVNKYTGAKLQSWLDELPGIFRDEMNGYDFELLFSGTKADFEDVRAAFMNHHVTVNVESENRIFQSGENRIDLVLKNELESSETKAAEIDQLNEWLNSKRNRRFNTDSFMHRYTELFQDPFVMILVGNGASETVLLDGFEVSIQNVENINEFPSEISDTPIIIMVDGEMFDEFDHIVPQLLNNSNVTPEQLFFIVSGDVDVTRVEREIVDSGIDRPNIIESYDDANLIKYFTTFSLMSYIGESISAYESGVRQVEELLANDTKRQDLQNKSVFQNVERLNLKIENAKKAQESIIQRDVWHSPDEFRKAIYGFIGQVNGWRKRTVKLTQDQAQFGAEQFSVDASVYFDEFKEKVIDIFDEEMRKITAKYTELMGKASLDNVQAQPVGIEKINFDDIQIEDFASSLLNISKIDMVRNRNIISLVKGAIKTDDSELVPEKTYPLQEWREYAIKNATSALHETINQAEQTLSKYYYDLFENGVSIIQRGLERLEDDKAKIVSDFSAEAKQIQEDNDWVSDFNSQLNVLKRS